MDLYADQKGGHGKVGQLVSEYKLDSVEATAELEQLAEGTTWETRDEFYVLFPALSVCLHCHCFAKPASSLCAELTVGSAQRVHRADQTDHAAELALRAKQNVYFSQHEQLRKKARELQSAKGAPEHGAAAAAPPARPRWTGTVLILIWCLMNVRPCDCILLTVRFMIAKHVT